MKNNIKRCSFCKGNMKNAYVNHESKWGEEFRVYFRNVVAEKCDKCGEVTFDVVTARMMMEVCLKFEEYGLNGVIVDLDKVEGV